MWQLGLLLFVGIGVLLGAVGSGGSIFAFPVFVYVMRVRPAEAVPLTMAIVGSASVVTAVLKWRRGEVHARALLLFATTGVGGAYLGARLTHLVPELVLTSLFAVILLAVGLLMYRNSPRLERGAVCSVGRCMAVGASIGTLSGFLGVGGGFLLVPALIAFAGLSSRKAIGTSVAIIALNSVSGMAGHLDSTSIDWSIVAAGLGALIPGAVLGVLISARIPEERLRRMLAAVMILLALLMGTAILAGLAGV